MAPPGARITSYNVCYTKLLRHQQEEAGGAAERPHQADGGGHRVAAGDRRHRAAANGLQGAGEDEEPEAGGSYNFV